MNVYLDQFQEQWTELSINKIILHCIYIFSTNMKPSAVVLHRWPSSGECLQLFLECDCVVSSTIT